MTKKLWQASLKIKLNSNLYSYESYISEKYNKEFDNKYINIFNWSIKNPNYFWSSIWDYCKVKGIKSKQKINKSSIFYKNIFLPKSKLNFGENLLSKNNNTKALTFVSENGFREERSWKELNNNVGKLISFFKKKNIKKKDRIASYTINSIETVESFVATSSIGAIWSSCSPDLGINGVIERFSQIKPKVLIVTDKYFYNGKEINILKRIPEILKKIPSVKYLIKTIRTKRFYVKVRLIPFN